MIALKQESDTTSISAYNPERNTILIGKGLKLQEFNLRFANRHGLIAGATGTGKTVTLQILAEGLSKAGVPSFVADVKGDLSGISQAGKPHPKVDERIEKIGINKFDFSANPCVFWDLFGKKGHPIRVTISEMGPVLLARLMELNDTQEGILTIAFTVADKEGMLLLDFKDLRAILNFVAQNSAEISQEYGNVSKVSVAAIQRKLLQIENEGADQFFGEPALNIHDFIRTDNQGRGIINILAADTIITKPRMYTNFLLWMMSELFEELPEVGDADKPKMVFFFDEAHLLFEDAPKALLQKIEQVVKLIRSKGVGIYFITQNPQDIPDDVLGQLGNKIQHALRAFTPKDQKAVRIAADTFRPNPAFDTKDIITQMGVGEALVSTLDEKGRPTMVDHTLIRPPESRIGPASESERVEILNRSPFGGKYDEAYDRNSAFEILKKRAKERAIEEEKISKEQEKLKLKKKTSKKSGRMGYLESAIKSVVRTIGSTIGRQIVRGILGSIMKK